jgi:predicted acetyltransferase
VSAPIDVRRCTDIEEFLDAVGAISEYFGGDRSQERAERFLRVHPLERMHAALDGGRIVGGAGAFPLEFSVPGALVPAAGVSVVGVYPTHRRRGVLTAMMRAQLDDVRRRREPLAALWASEERIYGRFGYGLASLTGEMSLPRERSGFAGQFERRGTISLVTRDEALELFPPVWDALREVTPGMFGRSRDWWETRALNDPPEWRPPGAGPKRFVSLELDGRPAGYAVYRHAPEWESGVASGTLYVVEALAVDPQATKEIWRYLLDIDWSSTVNARLLPVDHPLFFLLAEPRRMRFRVGDGLWLRLVDVGRALSARRYAADGRVVLEVADEFCPWNTGRWGLEAGKARRVRTRPDLRLDVQALASVYLGGFTFAELARAGRVEEVRGGALAEADAIFRVDRRPWCPEIF